MHIFVGLQSCVPAECNSRPSFLVLGFRWTGWLTVLWLTKNTRWPFQAERDEVGTASWSHVRVLVDPPPPPPARLTSHRADPPVTWRYLMITWQRSRDVTEGALGLHADEAYLFRQNAEMLSGGAKFVILKIWMSQIPTPQPYWPDLGQLSVEGPEEVRMASWSHVCIVVVVVQDHLWPWDPPDPENPSTPTLRPPRP